MINYLTGLRQCFTTTLLIAFLSPLTVCPQRSPAHSTSTTATSQVTHPRNPVHCHNRACRSTVIPLTTYLPTLSRTQSAISNLSLQPRLHSQKANATQNPNKPSQTKVPYNANPRSATQPATSTQTAEMVNPHNAPPQSSAAPKRLTPFPNPSKISSQKNG